MKTVSGVCFRASTKSEAPPGKKFDLLNLSDSQLFHIVAVIQAHSKYPEYIAMLRASCGEDDFELGMDVGGLVMEIEAFQSYLIETHAMTWLPQDALHTFVEAPPAPETKLGPATESGPAAATVLEDTSHFETTKSVPTMDAASHEAELANLLSESSDVTTPLEAEKAVPAIHSAPPEAKPANLPSTEPTDVPAPLEAEKAVPAIHSAPPEAKLANLPSTEPTGCSSSTGSRESCASYWFRSP